MSGVWNSSVEPPGDCHVRNAKRLSELRGRDPKASHLNLEYKGGPITPLFLLPGRSLGWAWMLFDFVLQNGFYGFIEEPGDRNIFLLGKILQSAVTLFREKRHVFERVWFSVFSRHYTGYSGFCHWGEVFLGEDKSVLGISGHFLTAERVINRGCRANTQDWKGSGFEMQR